VKLEVDVFIDEPYGPIREYSMDASRMQTFGTMLTVAVLPTLHSDALKGCRRRLCRLATMNIIRLPCSGTWTTVIDSPAVAYAIAAAYQDATPQSPCAAHIIPVNTRSNLPQRDRVAGTIADVG
jgi:hypothetical protein